MPLIAVNIRVSDRRVAVNIDTVKTISEFKEAIQASELNIPQERQKLIYSGRVLKDDDTVETYGIQNGQTVHLVQTPPPASSGPGISGTSAQQHRHQQEPLQQQQQQQQQQIPTSLASGAGAFNPYAGLTGARYAGQVPLPNASVFGPDPGNQLPPSPEQMQEIMNQPGFQQTMSQVLSDPRMVDYLIQSQPQLQAMGPGIRQVMQSEEFRRTLTDPTMLRNMFEMNRMFTQMGVQVPGMPTAPRQPAFPAPGVTNTTAAQQPARGTPPPQQQQAANPFEAIFQTPQPAQTGTNAPNPFMALFSPQSVQSPYGSPPPQSVPQQPTQRANQQGLGSPPMNPQQGPIGGGFPQSQQGQAASFGQGQPPSQTAFGQSQQPQTAFGQGQQPQAPFAQGQQPQAPFAQSQQPQAPFAQGQQPQAPFAQGQQPQLAFAQGHQPQDMASMYSMLQSIQQLQSLLGPAGPGPHVPQTGFMQPATTVPPADNRPLEERYQDQLRQLNDMGFTDYNRNISALRRTGGNVEAAIEMLVSGTI